MKVDRMEDWEETYRTLRKRNWFILALLSSFSYFILNPMLAAGVAFGGLVAIASFSAMQRTVRRAFAISGTRKSRKGLIIVKVFLRLFLLGAVLYILIAKVKIDPVGLAIGLSTVVLGIVSLGISQAWRMRPGRTV
jgi:hypothetical protein